MDHANRTLSVCTESSLSGCTSGSFVAIRSDISITAVTFRLRPAHSARTPSPVHCVITPVTCHTAPQTCFDESWCSVLLHAGLSAVLGSILRRRCVFRSRRIFYSILYESALCPYIKGGSRIFDLEGGATFGWRQTLVRAPTLASWGRGNFREGAVEDGLGVVSG